MNQNRKIAKKNTAKQNKKLIRELKAENRRLNKELAYMKQICAQYDPPEEEKITEDQKYFAESTKNEDVLQSKNYFSYLFARLRRSRVFRMLDKIRLTLKKFNFAKKLWFLLVTVFTFLGFSAQVLVVVGVFVVFLPVAVLVTAVLGIYTYLTHRKRKKLFRTVFSDVEKKEKIYLVLVPKRGVSEYFLQTLPELAEKGKVVLVFRKFRDCRSSDSGQTENNIYKIHVSVYFSFVRRLPPERIVKIYL